MDSTPSTVAGTPAETPKVLQSLFSIPLKKGITETEKNNDSQKNKQTALVYFVITAVVLALYGVFFFYPNLNRFLGIEGQIAELEKQVGTYNKNTLPALEEKRLAAKSKYELAIHESENVINQVFPATPDKIGIAERMESFASLINNKTPPFELNQISFEKPIKENNYTVLPFTTTITASRANLDRFFKLIDLSGRSDSEYHVRLMEIEKIDIRFLGQDSRTGLDKGVTANIKLKAYSR